VLCSTRVTGECIRAYLGKHESTSLSLSLETLFILSLELHSHTFGSRLCNFITLAIHPASTMSSEQTPLEIAAQAERDLNSREAKVGASKPSDSGTCTPSSQIGRRERINQNQSLTFPKPTSPASTPTSSTNFPARP
jgi:hypothetical protein